MLRFPLSFTAEPVAENLDLTGPVTLSARVNSYGPEMDLFARLLDVAPDGSAHLIVRGQVTVRRSTTPRDVTVSLGHAGYRVRPGHALRLMIAGTQVDEPARGVIPSPAKAASETFR